MDKKDEKKKAAKYDPTLKVGKNEWDAQETANAPQDHK